MNAVLYKVYIKDTHDSQYEQFESTEIMNEYRLREFFQEQIDKGNLDPKCLMDYGAELPDGTMDANKMSIDDIFGALAENDNYASSATCYCIEQFDIRLGDDDIYD